MKSISFALPNGLELGGVTVWSLNLSRSLGALGHPVHILEHVTERSVHGDAADATDISRLPVHGAPFALNRDEMRRFAETYRRVLPGVIVPNYSTGTYATCANLSRVQSHAMRVIGFAHTDEEEYYEHLRFYAPIIHRFVAVSEEIRQRLAERIPQRADDIVVRPYGIHVPTGLTHGYSTPGAPLRLTYAGRLVEKQKRVSDLIRLVDILTARGVDFVLTIAGEGEEAPAFDRLLRSPSTAARVEMVGRLAHREMEALWRRSDVCVLTSAYEGCSISMLEAMASGCIPVVTAVSGTSRFIRSGENGYTVPVGDMMGMADAIEALARDRARLPRLGRAAHDAVAATCEYGEYVRWFERTAKSLWREPAREWPRYRPLFRPTLQEMLTRGSRYVRHNHPILFNLYEQANYHVHRVLNRLPEGVK
ncbi:MAG TPA: glycosyltransferase family 4 protein [Rhodothermales bacterium]